MKRKPLRLLIFEPNHTGHHLVYLSFLLPAFLDLPVATTILTTRKAVESAEWASTIGPLADSIAVDTRCVPPKRKSPLHTARHRLRELRAGIDRNKPDHALVMYCDGVWQLATLDRALGRRLAPADVAVEAWMWRGAFVYPDAKPSDAVKRVLFRRLLNSRLFSALHIDDDLLHHYAASRTGAGGPTVALTPNPVAYGELILPVEARRRLGLPATSYIVALLGMIDRRKGAHLLLQSFASLRQEGLARPVHLVLAGPLDEQMRRMIAAEPWRALVDRGEVIVHDRFLSPRQMLEYSCACDLMTAPYPNHSGRSSLVIWAAAAGRPALGAARGCIGHVIRTEALGNVADPRDAEAFAEAIRATLEMDWTADDAARARAYASKHSIEAFRVSGSALVRERLGLPQAGPRAPTAGTLIVRETA